MSERGLMSTDGSAVAERPTASSEPVLYQVSDAGVAYAEDIALNCVPSSLAVMKRQLYAEAELPIVDASERAEQLMHESMRRSDFIEGITAFLQKRSPEFPPLAAHSDDT
jgi:enoyl-CoA hydratase/carnithine racemase